ncbi:MAG: hypothetical protein ACOC9B_00900 [Chloroflexota bacterium]
MNRPMLMQYGVPIGAIVIFVGSIIAVATCGETGPGPEEQAVLNAYQQGYVDGYSDGYSQGFSAGSRSEFQPQVETTTRRGCSTASATDVVEDEVVDDDSAVHGG